MKIDHASPWIYQGEDDGWYLEAYIIVELSGLTLIATLSVHSAWFEWASSGETCPLWRVSVDFGDGPFDLGSEFRFEIEGKCSSWEDGAAKAVAAVPAACEGFYRLFQEGGQTFAALVHEQVAVLALPPTPEDARDITKIFLDEDEPSEGEHDNESEVPTTTKTPDT